MVSTYPYPLAKNTTPPSSLRLSRRRAVNQHSASSGLTEPFTLSRYLPFLATHRFRQSSNPCTLALAQFSSTGLSTSRDSYLPLCFSSLSTCSTSGFTLPYPEAQSSSFLLSPSFGHHTTASPSRHCCCLALSHSVLRAAIPSAGSCFTVVSATRVASLPELASSLSLPSSAWPGYLQPSPPLSPTLSCVVSSTSTPRPTPSPSCPPSRLFGASSLLLGPQSTHAVRVVVLPYPHPPSYPLLIHNAAIRTAA